MSDKLQKTKLKRKLTKIESKCNDKKEKKMNKRRFTSMDAKNIDQNDPYKKKFHEKVNFIQEYSDEQIEKHSPYLDAIETPEVILKDHIISESLIIISHISESDTSFEEKEKVCGKVNIQESSKSKENKKL